MAEHDLWESLAPTAVMIDAGKPQILERRRLDGRHDLRVRVSRIDRPVTDAIEQLTDAARAVLAVHASGAQTIVEITRLDPQLGAALTDASTCQELREEEENEE